MTNEKWTPKVGDMVRVKTPSALTQKYWPKIGDTVRSLPNNFGCPVGLVTKVVSVHPAGLNSVSDCKLECAGLPDHPWTIPADCVELVEVVNPVESIEPAKPVETLVEPAACPSISETLAPVLGIHTLQKPEWVKKEGTKEHEQFDYFCGTVRLGYCRAGDSWVYIELFNGSHDEYQFDARLPDLKTVTIQSARNIIEDAAAAHLTGLTTKRKDKP
jgi:hypothetical protein